MGYCVQEVLEDSGVENCEVLFSEIEEGVRVCHLVVMRCTSWSIFVAYKLDLLGCCIIVAYLLRIFGLK